MSTFIPAGYRVEHHCTAQNPVERFGDMDEQALEQDDGNAIAIAGRIVSRRDFGKGVLHSY